jgi:hypothetical protein
VALSVWASLLLVRLYGHDEALSKEWSLFKCAWSLSRRKGAVVSSYTLFYGKEYFPDIPTLLHQRERWSESC